MPKPKREWTEDEDTAKRIVWAMNSAREHAYNEPWAAVVLAQVAVEIGLSFVVHALTKRQEPAMRGWIEGLPVDTLKRPEHRAVVNALLAGSGERIEDDAELWAAYLRHVERRNNFLHRCIQPSVDDALESMNTSTLFQDRLLKLTGAAAAMLDAAERMRITARRERIAQFVKDAQEQREP
jgi:hypothetical protein